MVGKLHGERPDPAPLEIDFEAEPEAPRYVVDRVFERQTVNVLSGDTGAAKSIIGAALTAAALTGGDWLGRTVYGGRVLVVDEENPARTVRSRLRALGLTNADRGGLRYFNRGGVRIGEERWTKWLRREGAAHAADLLIVDTAMAATSADVNDNDEVVRLFTEALRPVATELDLAIVVLHHERKHQPGQSRNPGQAMMGARQWAGQADAHVTVAVESDLTEEEGPDGARLLRRSFIMRPAEKAREGETNYPERVVVTSEKAADGQLRWMRVESEGRIEAPQTRPDGLARALGTVIEEGEMTTAALAGAVGEDSQSTTFRRGLDQATELGLLTKVRRGVYGPPEELGF
ncbi:MAG: AAA family ATPase [Thermoleophilaceae bacterium]